MYKFISACIIGISAFSIVKGVPTAEEVRNILETAITDTDDRARVDDYLSFVTQFGKLDGMDVGNVAEVTERFENWKTTDDRIKLSEDREAQSWKLGHTRFSDWSDKERSSILLDESFINSESRSAIESSNCKQVSLADSSAMSEFTSNVASYNVDHRTYDVAGIQDQGQCASCWDFSDVATLELNRNLDFSLTTDDDSSSSSFVKLSEQYVLDCIDDGIGTCDGGYPIFTLMWVSESTGICASSDYNDYTEEQETCDTSSCDKVDESVFDQLYCLSDESDTQVSYAASTFSVEFAFKVYSDFYDYTEGVYSCDTSDEFLGWHAVTIVGVTDDYYIVKNSWSTDWGIDGYFYMNRDSFDDCKMSHFAFVSFNDLSDALSYDDDDEEEESVPVMDVSKVTDIRSAAQASRMEEKSLEINENIPGINHIKIHGETNVNILIILGCVVAISLVLCLVGVMYKAFKRCKSNAAMKLVDANKSNEESALLDGYVAL